MRHLWKLAVGLCLVACLATASAEPFETNKPACGSHGTAIEFVDTPSEAATQAKKAEKLVFVLHVSGYFEDPRFT